ncbi:MAG TPA: SDR family oxidoreductase [Hyphomonadaceae bacterium]|nr:SDR family oxidoreductase [Hyphomonadaceae bacterium]
MVRPPDSPARGLMGRVAAITGAESGIGAACAAELAAQGADVAILYFKDEAAARQTETAATASGATISGVRIAVIQMDVTSEASVETGFDRIVTTLGLPDVLINSAGLNQSQVPVAEMSLAQWNQLIATDLTGAFLTCRRFVRDLRSAGRPGAIVNISSIHAAVVRAGAADYDAAKAGLDRFTATLALEAAPLGINVNAIAPGMILTPMNAHAVADEAYRSSLETSIPWGRAGKAHEVARLAAFLVSDDADYITGASVTIDGGLSLVLGQGA